MEYATKPDLKAKKPAEVIGTVGYHDGVSEIIGTKSADTTNASANTLDTTASDENRSAKFKNPRVRQDTGLMYSGQK